MQVLGSEEDVGYLREVPAQVLQENQVLDAPLPDDGGVVVVRCVTEVLTELVAVPLALLVDPGSRASWIPEGSILGA